MSQTIPGRPVASPARASRPPSSFAAENKGWLIAGAAAAGLAAAAAFNHAAARRAEARTPPAGRFVEVDGVRVHYVDRGAGTAVVLLHGNGVTLQDYEASGVLDLIVAAGHRVIAFDRPGFGYTDRPRATIWTPQAQAALLAAALERLGIRRAVVAGHSWGAMTALAMALDRPGLVSGLVLLSGYYYGTARPDVPVFALPAVPVLGDVLAHTVSPLSGALMGPAAIKASFAPAPVSPRFADFPIGLTMRPSQVRATAADSALMIPGAIALSRRYGELAMPVIVMAGEGDLIARSGNHAERLARDIAGSDLRVLPGEGHLFHYNHPEAVAAAIEDVARPANAG